MNASWKIAIPAIILAIFSLQALEQADEICDNGLDDDLDGLIDLNDPDCSCTIVDFQSMVPNSSFEDYSCCPSMATQMSCVEGWAQASGGTTDYMNLCGWTAADLHGPPLPFPDGEGVLRFIDAQHINTFGEKIPYKEYAGVCLNFPMNKDSLYRFELYLGFIENYYSPDINLSFFGTGSCANLPFSIGTDCPENIADWTLLTAQLVASESGQFWKKVNIEIQPDQDIEAIAIGPDCIMVDNLNPRFYFLDHFVLNKSSDFDFQLLNTLSPCSPDFTFRVKDQLGFQYQWYKEGVALVGETSAQLSEMQGNGRYQLRIVNANGCRISEDYLFEPPVLRREVTQAICPNEDYLFGNQVLSTPGFYVDTFSSIDGCDSIVGLMLEAKTVEVDTLRKQILSGSTFNYNNQSYDTEGQYIIEVVNDDGCINTVVLKLELVELYFPNVFTPNFDGINDEFKVYGLNDDVANIQLSIFDRWGALLYQGREWDGRSNGEVLNSGVYIYIIQVTTIQGNVLQYEGAVTLLK